jgi:predicted kinase
MLVVFGGLPGAGKTTVARLVAARCRAAYIRIDAIEQAMRSAGVLAAPGAVGPAGYGAAYALAEANLRLGLDVVADCVNPLPETRAAWRAVAAPGPILEVEVVCSDAAEHRRRVETRVSDLPGLVPPTWEAVLRHGYEGWTGPRFVLDTAPLSADEAASRVCDEIASRRRAG